MMNIFTTGTTLRLALPALCVIALAAAGAGLAGAQVHQHGNSTTIIEQRGGSGATTTEITRYPDGQTIITRDGSSVDITIQREGRFVGSAPGSKEYFDADVDCYERRFLDKRFSGEGSAVQEAFRKRMLNRMGW